MLKYIKTNNVYIKLEEGLNIIDCQKINKGIENNNNIGKTTLIRIIKCIFGNGRRPISTGMSYDLKVAGINAFVEWLFDVNGIKYKFSYNPNEPDEIKLNDSYPYTLDGYKRKIAEILNSQIKVVMENHNYNLKFIKTSASTKGFKDLFPQKSESYKGLFLLKILDVNNEDEESLELINSYFSEVAKRNSYRSLRGRYHREITDLIDKGSEYLDLVSERSGQLRKLHKMKKISKEMLDSEIIDEIVSLNIPNLDIQSVIKFHEQITDDYNNLINDEISKTTQNIHRLDRDINKWLELDYNILDINITKEINAFLEEENIQLKLEYEKIKPTIEYIINKYTKKVSDFGAKLIEFYPNSGKPDSMFMKGRGDTILETIKYRFNPPTNIGDSGRYISFCLAFAHFLVKTKIDIVALDTAQISEIDGSNFIHTLRRINDVVKNKQYIVVTFESLTDHKDFYIPLTLGKAEKSLFGKDF